MVYEQRHKGCVEFGELNKRENRIQGRGIQKKKQISWLLISRVVTATGKVIINDYTHRGILRFSQAALSNIEATREMWVLSTCNVAKSC